MNIVKKYNVVFVINLIFIYIVIWKLYRFVLFFLSIFRVVQIFSSYFNS